MGHSNSATVSHAVITGGVSQAQGQLIGVALSFLRNFGIFSGASGVLGALSRGVAAIGTDQAAQEVLPLACLSGHVLSMYHVDLAKAKKGLQ